MRAHNHNRDLIRYRYNIVSENGRTVIRAVPVKTCRAQAGPEPAAVERNDSERERVHITHSTPVLRRLRHRLLDR
ncbi:MAG TPA: hypothetical protein VKU87_06735 [Thermomicrobiaceae bacterium]|nr:hypothetical protein [Thermomicrobiaceae bacterium]